MAAQDYASLLLSYGLAGLWMLNDDPGSLIVRDTSGNGNDAAVHGGVILGQSGPFPASRSPAALFDGTTGYITTPYAADPSLTDFSVEAWINPLSVAVQNDIVAQENGSGTGRNALFLAPGGEVQTNVGGIVLASGVNAVVMAWTHAVMTCQQSSGMVILYVNGLAAASATRTPNSATGIWEIGTGKAPPKFPFNGRIAGVAFHQSLLSAAQIAALYAAALLNPVCRPPWDPLDDGLCLG